MPRSFTGAPVTIKVAAGLLAVLGCVFVVLGILELASTQAERPEVGITTGLGFLCYAALVIFAARGLLRLRRWARSVGICVALLQIPIAISFWGGQTTWIAITGLVSSLIIGGGLLSPAATKAIMPELEADQQ